MPRFLALSVMVCQAQRGPGDECFPGQGLRPMNFRLPGDAVRGRVQRGTVLRILLVGRLAPPRHEIPLVIRRGPAVYSDGDVPVVQPCSKDVWVGSVSRGGGDDRRAARAGKEVDLLDFILRFGGGDTRVGEPAPGELNTIAGVGGEQLFGDRDRIGPPLPDPLVWWAASSRAMRSASAWNAISASWVSSWLAAHTWVPAGRPVPAVQVWSVNRAGSCVVTSRTPPLARIVVTPGMNASGWFCGELGGEPLRLGWGLGVLPACSSFATSNLVSCTAW